MIKNIIKKFFIILGFRIIKYNINTETLNTKNYISFKKNNKKFKLYNIALQKSQNEKSDNIEKKIRFNYLIQLAEKILSKKKVYNFVECGCWKGHSSFILATLIAQSKKKIKFHIFDSFRGLSKITKSDSELYKVNKKQKKNVRDQFISNEDFIKKHVLKNFKFCKTYAGWIPSRFEEIKNEKFSFVHIDVDLYEPTMKSLEFFFPRLVKGGIIVCDDYNSNIFNGAKKAWDKYFKNIKFDYFFHNPLGGCFLIK